MGKSTGRPPLLNKKQEVALYVYASLALIHTRDTLELFVDRFGDKRILFSTTPATNGAGMASLAHSNLSNSQKKNIASANLIRLLQKDNTIDENDCNFDESLWLKFINKRIVPTEIIDGAYWTTQYTDCKSVIVIKYY